MIERKNYKDIDYKPFVFLVVFGVRGEHLTISASKHHVDELPEGIDINCLNRDEHADYIDGFFSGSMGEMLRAQDEDLLNKCKSAHECVVIRGEIQKDDCLDYMRNIIGIGKAFLDQGALGILDLLTFTLYSEKTWTDEFFEQDINAQNHVKIQFSEEDGKIWLHTRGLIEFGRPDLSMYAKDNEEAKECQQILNQMIFYSGEGVFFNGKFKLHTFTGNTYEVESEFVDDFDNDDFNNAYCNVRII